MLEIPTKRCLGKCKQLKNLNSFSKCKGRKDGLQKWCKPCAKEYKDTYRALHKVEISAQGGDYYQRNRQKTLEKQKITRSKNRNKRRIYETEYYTLHKEEIAAYKSQWMKDNPEKVVSSRARRRALEDRAVLSGLNEGHWKQMVFIYKEAARLTRETGIKHHVDHILPIRGKDITGLHAPWNLQILTASENLKKSIKFDFTYNNESWRFF